MRKYIKHLCAILILLCTSASAWGATSYTATYTVASKTSVSTTGTTPTGSSATFSQSGNNDAGQMTANGTTTLTLSGYEGKKITAISLYIRKTSGTKTAAVTANTGGSEFCNYTIASNNLPTSFATCSVSLSSTPVIDEDATIIVGIKASANSVYISSYTITWEDATPHDVSFVTGEGNPSVATRRGVSITLPDEGDLTPACSSDGWELYGWTTSAYGSSSTTTAPTATLVGYGGDTYWPDDDVTLYAVYTKVATNEAATAQTLSFVYSSMWTKYHYTDKSSYWLIHGNDGYIESPKLNDLSTITSIVVQAGYFGGSAYGKFQLSGVGTNYGSEQTCANNNESTSITVNPDSNPLSGAGKIKLLCTGTASSDYGVRVKTITINYTAPPSYYWSAPTCAACTTLDAPENLVESNVTPTSVQLSWDAVSNASSYKVTIEGSVYEKVVNGLTTTSVTIDDLSEGCGADYLWTVKAIGDGGDYCDSEESETGDFTTPTLSSIAVSGTYPTSFVVGDAFSHGSQVVTATYSNSATKVVTGSCSWTGYNMSSAGDQTVTVSYTECATNRTTTYGIHLAQYGDYKFSCADLSLTDEEEAVSKTPIWITTSAGQIVRSQKALHIEGTGLKPSSTFTFTIGGVDANDCSGTGEHDLFAIRQADYSAVATDAYGNIDMDVYVFYNPTGATDGLDLAGSTIVATSASGTVAGKEYMSLSVTLSTTSVNGRHLPNQFVMAARIGKTWYALPGNITENATQDPVMIGVDNATNPTIAYCPAAYGFRIVSLASTEAHPNGNTANNATGGRGFHTDGEKVKFGLQNSRPMFGSTTTTLGPSSASTLWSGGKDYFWTLEHQNTAASNINAVTYNIRTANTNSNPLIRLSRGQWKWGLYSNGVEEIRLLSISPVQDLTLEVMEWGTTAIAVKYNGGGSLTNVKIGDSEEGEATMSTICGDIKCISGLSSLVAGASGKQGQQMLIQITESEVLKQKIVQVPFIVNSTDVTTDNLRTWTGGATTAEQDSITYNMEIVVRPGAKITTNNGSGKFGKLSIYPGGMADISNAIRLTHFTMRGGYSWLGGAFAMPHAKVTGNVTGTGNQVVYDYYIDATKYYDLAVPKTMTWLPVTDETGNEDFTFWVKWYNGETRASTGKGWTWYDWSGEASSWSINMGQGYLVAAQPPTGRNYFIMRFPMSITLASDESTKAPIAVTAHGMTAGSLNPGISANNAGWNLIANPFLTSYKKDADGVDGGGEAISGSIAIGELVPEIKEGNPTGKYVWDATGAKNIRYVTTYDYATATYEQHPMSSTVLEPFTGFFIQVAKDCYVRFDASGRQNNVIRRRVESLPDDMEIGITASSDEESDETILLLCDDLSRDNALEFPDESSKLINTGHLNFYTFAGATSMYANGMSYAEGQEWNAAGITPTKSGVYSFTVTKVNTSYVEGVLLKDLVSNIEYDLLKDNVDIHLDPGTIDDRFLVKIVLKNEEETPTALDEITEGSINQRPEKIIYNDKMYIRYNGVIYDATGKRVREVNK